MQFPAIGASYTLPSVNADCQRSLNLFPEAIESGAGKNRMILRRTPGTSIFSAPTYAGSTGPIRAIWPGENRLFVVSGQWLFEVFQDGTYQDYQPSVGNDGNPAQIIANGNQLLIISAGNAYVTTVPNTLQIATMGTTRGVCNTNGTAVSWVDGNETEGQATTTGQFEQSWVGQTIIIGTGLLPYVIGSVADPNDLVLTTSAGVQANVPFWLPYLQGTCFTVGPNVIYDTGDAFDTVHAVGATIAVNNIYSTIVRVISTGSVETNYNYGFGGPYTFWYDPVIVATTGCYLDGYYIVAEPYSKIFRLSQLLDGSEWDPLDYASKEAYPDNIAALTADHEQLYLMGDEQGSEVWQDTGAETFPFQRDPGGFIPFACFAPWSLSRLDQGLAWIGGDENRGGPVCYYAQGFQPVRISNHAVEQAWESYTTVVDAQAYTYIEGGHQFLVINFPTANKTWVYDRTESVTAQQNLWHERGWWNGATDTRQRQSNHAYVGLGTAPPAHYCGDWQNGNIYKQSQALLSDNGTLIHRIRTCPHIGTENLRSFFSRYELLAGVQSGTINPTLSYSVDYGNTFINAQQRSSAQSGVSDQYQTRLLWWRLGNSRDRVFSVDIKDIADFTIIDMFYDAEPGYA